MLVIVTATLVISYLSNMSQGLVNLVFLVVQDSSMVHSKWLR